MVQNITNVIQAANKLVLIGPTNVGKSTINSTIALFIKDGNINNLSLIGFYNESNKLIKDIRHYKYNHNTSTAYERCLFKDNENQYSILSPGGSNEVEIIRTYRTICMEQTIKWGFIIDLSLIEIESFEDSRFLKEQIKFFENVLKDYDIDSTFSDIDCFICFNKFDKTFFKNNKNKNNNTLKEFIQINLFNYFKNFLEKYNIFNIYERPIILSAIDDSQFKSEIMEIIEFLIK
ncbi:MAG: hypothetical protein ACTSRZ_15650 [Promethearchaeota archaeon]